MSIDPCGDTLDKVIAERDRLKAKYKALNDQCTVLRAALAECVMVADMSVHVGASQSDRLREIYQIGQTALNEAAARPVSRKG